MTLNLWYFILYEYLEGDIKMGKFNIKKIIDSSKLLVDKHSPEILTGLGITGMVCSTVLAVKATPKALDLIEERKYELDTYELTGREIIKTCWKCYLPSVITGGVSVACLIGANKVNNKRNIMLATAYNLSERTLTEYRNKVVDVIGEEKEREIRSSVANDRVANKNLSDAIIVCDKGNTLCYDTISGRYFKCDADKIRKAENILNRKLMSDAYVSLNDFYDLIGLPFTQIGDDLGWVFNGDMIEIQISACLSEDDTPCIVLDYSIEPKHDYQKLI